DVVPAVSDSCGTERERVCTGSHLLLEERRELASICAFQRRGHGRARRQRVRHDRLVRDTVTVGRERPRPCGRALQRERAARRAAQAAHVPESALPGQSVKPVSRCPAIARRNTGTPTRKRGLPPDITVTVESGST